MALWWPASTSSPAAQCFSCLSSIFDWQSNHKCEFTFPNCCPNRLFFLLCLFCAAKLWIRWLYNKCSKTEILMLSCVMWRGKSWLNYSMALLCSARCAWWLDLQGLYCWEENLEFYDRSGKNGTGSGFCQTHPNWCRNHQMRPVNMERVRTQRNRISLRLR